MSIEQVIFEEVIEQVVFEGEPELILVSETEIEIVEFAEQGPPGGPGTQGLKGDKGDKGDPGSGGDLAYVHYQDAPATLWEVTHNLGKYPSATIVDSAGTEVYGDVVYTGVNTLALLFAAEFSGRAFCN